MSSQLPAGQAITGDLPGPSHLPNKWTKHSTDFIEHRSINKPSSTFWFSTIKM